MLLCAPRHGSLCPVEFLCRRIDIPRCVQRHWSGLFSSTGNHCKYGATGGLVAGKSFEQRSCGAESGHVGKNYGKAGEMRAFALGLSKAFALSGCRSFHEAHGGGFTAVDCSTSHPDGTSGVGEVADDDTIEGEDYCDALTGSKSELKAGLYLVGTPIGNLEDITLRALRVLKSATLILAEDTRHSSKLLRHYAIQTPTMSYHKFNEFSRRDQVISRLQQGEVLALISDAGMPGISDPGSELVTACVEANVEVFPIPGPSAVITALVASGLPTNEFSFVGFLPSQSSSRHRRLATAANECATQVFYVPPHKLCRVLDDCILAFGPSRRCAVAREMTKLHEEFWRGTLEQAQAEFTVRNPRGEMTLLIEGQPEGASEQPRTEDELKSRLQSLMAAGKTPSEATKQVVLETSARRNIVYPLALALNQKEKKS